MKNYRFKLHGFEYVRISKKKARTLYNAGFEIVLNPVNLRLDNLWHTYFMAQKETDNNREFDVLCNSYEHYNCSNSGYTAFYVPVFNCLLFNFKDGSNPYYAVNRTHNEIIEKVLKWARNWDVKQMKSNEKNIFFAVLESKMDRG